MGGSPDATCKVAWWALEVFYRYPGISGSAPPFPPAVRRAAAARAPPDGKACPMASLHQEERLGALLDPQGPPCDGSLPCLTDAWSDAQSDQVLGHGARSSRTSWGRRSSCYSRWMDTRCARAPQIPPHNPRLHPFPSRTLSTCLAALHSALSVRAGGFGPQVSVALLHALWLGRVLWVPSARVPSEMERILSLKPAHCACGCLYSCVWRRGTLVVDAGACLGVCGGLGTARRPPDRVHGPRRRVICSYEAHMREFSLTGNRRNQLQSYMY